MVPCVAARGHSFKGAGLYYLHDKREDQEAERLTSDRVAWTHTHNLPTNDPEKGMKWMAYTSMNAEALKARAGGDRRGRKATAGAVYSYSLAWHPEQKPEKEEMLNASLSTIKELGLDDHQVVIVAHQETDHKHVHVICNLVHPETGKTAKISCDRLTLSEWAETYERDHGKVYCQNRAENNQKRKELAQEQQRPKELTEQFNDQAQEQQGRGEEPRTGFVKHRGQKLDRAQRIQELYTQSDGGKAFKTALEEEGYRLAKGDRRGFVLVDEQGKVHSLSRQLKGQRAKDIRDRIGDLEGVKPVNEVVSDVMTHDRDAEEVKRQRQLDEAANTQERKREILKKEASQKERAKLKQQRDKARRAFAQTKSQQREVEEQSKSQLPPKAVSPIQLANDHLRRFDEKTEWDDKVGRQRHRLEEQQKQTYGRKEHVQRMRELQNQIDQLNSSILGRRGQRLKSLQNDLDAERKTLQNIDQRIAEQNQAFENKIKEETPEHLRQPPPTVANNVVDLDQEKKRKLAEQREQARQRLQRRDRSQDQDLRL